MRHIPTPRDVVLQLSFPALHQYLVDTFLKIGKPFNAALLVYLE
jgi:hypothetical protein